MEDTFSGKRPSVEEDLRRTLHAVYSTLRHFFSILCSISREFKLWSVVGEMVVVFWSGDGCTKQFPCKTHLQQQFSCTTLSYPISPQHHPTTLTCAEELTNFAASCN